MNKKTYMKKFSRIVRWRLPPKEADEVLSDYEGILLHYSENDNTLIQELGHPSQTAQMLTEPKAYHRWLAVFGVMTLCLLLLEIILLRAQFYLKFWECILPCFLVCGAIVPLAWFRTCRCAERLPMPKGLLPIIGALLLALFLAGGMIWGLTMGIWEWIPPERSGFAARLLLWAVGTAGALTAFGGLIQSRLSDYRWRALYIMGLTVLIECTMTTVLLTSLSPLGVSWWIPYAISFSITGIFGLIITGVSLC